MIYAVERAHAQLQQLGEPQEISNSAMLQMIEQCMTTEMINEWVKLITDTKQVVCLFG